MKKTGKYNKNKLDVTILISHKTDFNKEKIMNMY